MTEIIKLLAGVGMAGATALFATLSLAAFVSGNDYKKEGDLGATLVCFGTGIIMALITVLLGVLTTKVILGG